MEAKKAKARERAECVHQVLGFQGRKTPSVMNMNFTFI